MISILEMQLYLHVRWHTCDLPWYSLAELSTCRSLNRDEILQTYKIKERKINSQKYENNNEMWRMNKFEQNISAGISCECLQENHNNT